MSQPWERVAMAKHQLRKDGGRREMEAGVDMKLSRWSDEVDVPDTGRRVAKTGDARASASSVSE